MSLFGRTRELEGLAGYWQRSKAGEGQTVLVTGAIGLGKTKLLEAFAKQVATDSKIDVLHYSGSPYHLNTPFHALAMEANRGPQDDRAQALVKAVSAPQTLNTIAEIRARRKKLINGFSNRALPTDAQTPRVLIFDDIHFLDPSSLEVLNKIADEIKSRPMMLVLGCRPGTKIASGDLGENRINIEPLNNSAITQIIAEASSPAKLPDSLTEMIVESAAGNPFFARELTLNLIDTARDNGDSQMASLPATLKDIMQNRIDRLGSCRNLLHMASVIGPDVDLALLAKLDNQQDTFQRRLDDLVASGLVTTAVETNSETPKSLRFCHQFVHECAYGGVLKQARIEVHDRVAKLLMAEENRSLNLIAWHLEQADRPTSAAHYWALAGEQAAANSADAEAVAHFDAALDLIHRFPDIEAAEEFETSTLLKLLPSLIGSVGYVGDASSAIDRAVELTQARTNPGQAFSALFLRWLEHLSRGTINVAHTFSLRLRPLVQRADRDIVPLVFDRMLGSTHMFRGELAKSHDALEAFIANYDDTKHYEALRPYGVTDNYTTVQCCRVCVATLKGDVETGNALRENLIKEAEKLGRTHNLCHALAFGCAHSAALQLDWERVGDYANRLLRLATTYDLPFWTRIAGFYLAMVQDAEGNTDAASQLFDEALVWSRQQSVGFLIPTFMILRVSAKMRDPHQLPDIDDELSDIDLMLQDGEHWLHADLLRLRALAVANDGKIEVARLLLQRSIEVAGEQGAELLKARSVAALAQLNQDTVSTASDLHAITRRAAS